VFALVVQSGGGEVGFFQIPPPLFSLLPPPRLWSGGVRVLKLIIRSFFAGSGKEKKRKRSLSLLFFLFFLARQTPPFLPAYPLAKVWREMVVAPLRVRLSAHSRHSALTVFFPRELVKKTLKTAAVLNGGFPQTPFTLL